MSHSSSLTGIAIAACGEDGEPLLRFFESVSIVMMKITTWIIHLAPIGVCFLVAQQLIEKSDLAEEFKKLAWYFLTVILGLTIHGFIVLPVLFTIVTRKLPFRSEILYSVFTLPKISVIAGSSGTCWGR